MVVGGIVILLIVVIYTIATGRLALGRNRVTYGMPARAAALLGLVPMMLLVSFSVRLGGIANVPGGLFLFVGVLVASFAVIYAVGWPFGESIRR